MWRKPTDPDPVRGTGRYRMVPHKDGTPGYEMLDQYTEVLPPGFPWGRVLLALVMGAFVVLLILGALSAWSWVTGGGVTAQLTTCPVHLAHHPLPSALPSVPVH